MSSIDQVLLRRILRALGISVLSVGQQSCDSLRDRDALDEPVSPRASSGVDVGTSRAGAPAFGGSPASGGAVGSAGIGSGAVGLDAGKAPEPRDAGAGQPVAPLSCPAEARTNIGVAENAILARPGCTSEEHFVGQVVCVASPRLDGAGKPLSCEQGRPDDECLLQLYFCGLQSVGDAVLCGPFEVESGECCYVVGGSCPVGRPFVVAGVARLAALSAGASWCAPSSPALDGLSAPLRAALAEAYLLDGASEHASVASFSRFALQLLARGAPSELVEAALQAASDEVRHARACLGLAAAYAGVASSPTALQTDDALRDGTSALHVALSLASEGCIAETVSAQLVAAAAMRARDPFVRDTLQAIARDEAEHVELAWKALSWLLGRAEPGVRQAVAELFARAHEHVGFGARVEHDLPDDAMADHGYLSIAERARIATETLEQVVRPAARWLLGTETRPAIGPALG